jgi:hypothetical protein
VDDLESHNGAETMPISKLAMSGAPSMVVLAILVEDIEALLDEQRRV